MAPRQLRCHDLRGGDIMLQLNSGNLAHRAIAFAQWVAGQRDSHVIHVGIMRGESYMIESEKRGIWAADLRVQDKDYGYLVYRPRNALLGTAAANMAKLMYDANLSRGSFKRDKAGDLQFKGGTLRYNVGGLPSALSTPGANPRTRDQMDDMADRIFTGMEHPFYCSQFVVMTYQFAAEQMGMPARSVFPLEDAKVSPATLSGQLARNGQFEHVGAMAPKER
jgi:hypothetical protein